MSCTLGRTSLHGFSVLYMGLFLAVLPGSTTRGMQPVVIRRCRFFIIDFGPPANFSQVASELLAALIERIANVHHQYVKLDLVGQLTRIGLMFVYAIADAGIPVFVDPVTDRHVRIELFLIA